MEKISKKGTLVKTFHNRKEEKTNKLIGLFGLFAMTGATIMNVVFYPSFAGSGFNSILWLLVGGLLWFLPVSLCAAEMATVKQWSQRGGLYNWSMMMLGKRWGWTAIFFQWFQLTIIYFVDLDFIITGMFFIAGHGNYFDTTAGMPLYLGYEKDAIKWALMIFLFFILTVCNSFGIGFNEWFSKFSLPLGIILPAILIIIFGFWSYSTHAGGITIPSDAIKDHDLSVVPTFSKDALSNVSQLVIFSTFIVSYTGIEQSASLIRRTKNPKRNYPISVLMVTALLIILPVLASVALVLTVNVNDPNFTLYNGVYESFQNWIEGTSTHASIFGINSNEASAVTKFICFLIVMGGIGTMNAIIIEPSTAIHSALVDMKFPARLTKVNRWKVHYNILILQFALMFLWNTILSFVNESGNIAFTTSVNLAVITYLVSYVLLFISYLKLTLDKRCAGLEKSSIIVGGKPVKTIVGIIGLILTLFSLAVSFAQPEDTSIPLYLDVYIPTIVVLYAFILSVPPLTYQMNFHHKYKKPIIAFLKSKNFDAEEIAKVWKLYKKDETHEKMSAMLVTLGMDKSLVSY